MGMGADLVADRSRHWHCGGLTTKSQPASEASLEGRIEEEILDAIAAPRFP